MWGEAEIYYGVVSYMCLLCSFILVWVFVLLGMQVFEARGVSALEGENQWLEFAWTAGPTVLVLVLGVINMQYVAPPRPVEGESIVKVTGHQWYWTYEVDNGEAYDSYMSDYVMGVDKPLVLTSGKGYSVVAGSSDVIHSFSLPALHLKVDCIPGRVNEVFLWLGRMGVFVGYCTELCGAGHAHMPIVLESLPKGKC